MASQKHTPEAPQLPPGPIDFDALQAACKAGKSPEEALAASIVEPEPIPEAEPAPVESDAAETDAKEV